ncbi:MAG: FliH/SctL family protein [Bryobacteraceae bacterium]
MSSRIVSGKAADQAQGFEWRTPQTAGSQQARAAQVQTPDAQQALQVSQARVHELESLIEARAKEAYARGSREAAQQAEARLEPAIQRYAAAAHELAIIRPRARREAEEDVVTLAVAIARKLLHREIAVDPDSLLGLVKAALQKIDSRELHRIRVHPEDSVALENALNAAGTHRRIEISVDSGLERGAAIFETVRGNLDASIDTQIKEIERGFLDLVRARR